MSGDNKGSSHAVNFEKCSVVLVDVLGTTTAINFAKETLFPFVTKNAEEVLKAKWEDEAVKSAVKQLKEGDEEVELETAVKLVKDLTEKESDNPGLKSIQGIIYEKGYESGDLKAHVFSDVPAAFESWAKSHKVAVYSTGSIDSQKQLFTNSTEGDLSAHISKYFDQTVGPKTESGSYKKIAEELGVKPEEVLFITDLIEEAKAAKTAGLLVAVVTREGNDKLPEDIKDYPVISSFSDITFENPSKRKNIDEPAVTEEPPSKLAKTEAESAKPEEEVKKADEVETTETVEGEAMEVDAPVEVSESPKKEVKCDKPETITTETVTTESTQKTESEEKTESKESLPVEDVAVVKADAVETNTPNAEIAKSEEKTEETIVDSTDKTEVAAKAATKTTQNEAEAMEEESVEEKVTEDAKKEESKEVNGDVAENDEPASKEKTLEEQVDSTSVDVKDSGEAKVSEVKEKIEEKVKSSEAKSSADAEETTEASKSVVESSEVATTDCKETKESTEAKETSTKTAEVTSSEEKVDSTETKIVEANGKIDDEKENKKDLANGLESGEKEKATSNGDATEELKVNGDSKTDETKEEPKEKTVESAGQEETAEEIKVKKSGPSAAGTETPAVIVDV